MLEDSWDDFLDEFDEEAADFATLWWVPTGWALVSQEAQGVPLPPCQRREVEV